MIIHELATNAAKYGAFSNPVGWVEVKWKVQKSGSTEIIYFQWKEHEGPPVTQISQKGFGSLLIASTIETELHGKAETKIEPDGLYFCASFPIDSIILRDVPQTFSCMMPALVQLLIQCRERPELYAEPRRLLRTGARQHGLGPRACRG